MDKIIEEMSAMGIGNQMGRNKIRIVCYANGEVRNPNRPEPISKRQAHRSTT